jgi:hypothetical protein
MVILLPPLLSLCSLSLPAPVPSWLSRMVLLHRVLTHLGPVLLFWVFFSAFFIYLGSAKFVAMVLFCSLFSPHPTLSVFPPALCLPRFSRVHG